MAVYKPTLCYPFAKGLDIRTGVGEFNSNGGFVDPAQFLTCRIETSNVNIVGYSIALYSASHERLFPKVFDSEGKAYVSPISELQKESLGYNPLEPTGINSGVNGSTLRIPFFRCPQVIADYDKSLNAVYYKGNYIASHALLDSTLAPVGYFSGDTTGNVDYWGETDRYGDRHLICYTDTSHTTISPDSYTGSLKIDNEPLILGDLVAVFSSNSSDQEDKGGIYEVVSVEAPNDVVEIMALRRVISFATGDVATIWQGQQLHNTSWTVNSSGSGAAFIPSDSMWVDCLGNSIELNSSGSTYQWEITLYQGTRENGSPLPIDRVSGLYPRVRFESLVGKQWFDNIVAGGQIMGSTPERLQIADDDEAYLPGGTDTDPLVLQDTFCSIIPASAGSLPDDYKNWVASDRFVVHDYDSVFGHAYPSSNTLLALPQNRQAYCAFYQHSNNPQEILDTDIVDYVFESNAPLHFYHVTGGQWYDDGNNADNWTDSGVSVTERYIVCESIDTSTLSGTLRGVSQILLIGQSSARENGVWQLFTMTAKVSEQSVTRVCLKRAASYTTWANFIGKVIYAERPTGQSYTSLAAPGGDTLWDPNDLTGQYGVGILKFDVERPMLLFRKKLYSVGGFNGVVQTVDFSRTYSTALNDSTNSYPWNVGNYVADKSGTIYSVRGKQSQGTSTMYALGYIGTVGTDGYINVSKAAYNSGNWDYMAGGCIYQKDNNSWHQTWDLHRAKVLFNSEYQTYITPWTKGLIDGRMALKFISPGFARINGKKEDIIKINTCNEVTFKITHTALTEPIPSYDASNSSVPFRYNICSYFRVSDPNPFVSYELPYLRLYIEGNLINGLGRLNDGDGEDILIDVNDSLILDVDDAQITVRSFIDADELVARKISLSADYVQFNHSAWECYQWRLFSGDGTKLLQDTGRRFDGLIQSTFFGLANELDEAVPYIAQLVVENDLGDILQYNIRFKIAKGSAASFIEEHENECWFTAQHDCNTQSNLLVFQWREESELPQDTPTTYSIYRREYEVYDKPGECFDGYAIKDGQGTVVDFCSDSLGQHPLPRISGAMYRDITPDSSSYNYIFGYEVDGRGFYELDSTYKEYKGEWEPVVVMRTPDKSSYIDRIRDFNITNGRTYQYIIYPAIGEQTGDEETCPQTFANYLSEIWASSGTNSGSRVNGTYLTSPYNGGPVGTNGQCWSMVELVPESFGLDVPIIDKVYHVDNNNIWLFDFNVETGEQTQNISRDEFTGLGQYAKMGYGKMNYVSGSVSAQLGSELVCASQDKYIERLPGSRVKPLSSNEKAEMLKKWRSFVYSSNPKLLRDIKGQSWIVQIISSSNTPKNYYHNVPDMISFQWKQVASPHGTIIYSEYGHEQQEERKLVGSKPWNSVFAGTKGEVVSSNIPYEITFGNISWTYGGATTPYGTLGKIKLGNEGPVDDNDYTYRIDGSGNIIGQGATYGNVGGLYLSDGQQIDTPTVISATQMYIWVDDANFPLEVYAPTRLILTNTRTNAYKMTITRKQNINFGAQHGAYPVEVIVNGAKAEEDNPVFIPAFISGSTDDVATLEFTFVDGFVAPATGDTTNITVTNVTDYSWTQGVDDEHGTLTLGPATGPVSVSVTGYTRPAAPVLRKSDTNDGYLEWDSVSGVSEYEVLVDNIVIDTVQTTSFSFRDLQQSIISDVHFFTVRSVGQGGVVSIQSNAISLRNFSITFIGENCAVDTSDSDSVLWEGSTAELFVDFTNGKTCPWVLNSDENRVSGANYEWIILSQSRGKLFLSNPDTNNNNNRYIYVTIKGGDSLAAPVVTLDAAQNRLTWPQVTNASMYMIIDTSGNYPEFKNYVFPSTSATQTWSFKQLQINEDDHLFTVIACGTSAYNLGIGFGSSTSLTNYATIEVICGNGVVPAQDNSTQAWKSGTTYTSTQLYFDFVNGYKAPLVPPQITGATASWARTDTSLLLTLSNITTDITFTLEGTKEVGVGSVISMALETGGGSKKYRVLKLNGTVAEVVMMGLVPDQIPFSFDSTSDIYQGSALDEACSDWYDTLTTQAKNAIVTKTIQQDKWNYALNSTEYTYSDSTGSTPYSIGLANASYGASIQRDVYALSIQDIIDFAAEGSIIQGGKIHEWLWGANSITSNYFQCYLRSATSYTGGAGVFKGAAYITQNAMQTGNLWCYIEECVVSVSSNKYLRPAFQIDLSQYTDYTIEE